MDFQDPRRSPVPPVTITIEESSPVHKTTDKADEQSKSKSRQTKGHHRGFSVTGLSDGQLQVNIPEARATGEGCLYRCSSLKILSSQTDEDDGSFDPESYLYAETSTSCEDITTSSAPTSAGNTPTSTLRPLLDSLRTALSNSELTTVVEETDSGFSFSRDRWNRDTKRLKQQRDEEDRKNRHEHALTEPSQMMHPKKLHSSTFDLSSKSDSDLGAAFKRGLGSEANRARVSISPAKGMSVQQKLDQRIDMAGPDIYEDSLKSTLPPSPWSEETLRDVFEDQKTLPALVDHIIKPCVTFLDDMIMASKPDTRHERLYLRAMMKTMGVQLEPLLTPQPGYIPKPYAPVAFAVPSENIYENLALETRNLFQGAHLLDRFRIDPEVMAKASDADFIQARSQLSTHWLDILVQAIGAERVNLKEASAPAEKIATLKSAQFMLKALNECAAISFGSHENCTSYMQHVSQIIDWVKSIDTMDEFAKAKLDHLTKLFGSISAIAKSTPLQSEILELMGIYIRDTIENNEEEATSTTREEKADSSSTELKSREEKSTVNRFFELMSDLKHLDATLVVEEDTEMTSLTFAEKNPDKQKQLKKAQKENKKQAAKHGFNFKPMKRYKVLTDTGRDQQRKVKIELQSLLATELTRHVPDLPESMQDTVELMKELTPQGEDMGYPYKYLRAELDKLLKTRTEAQSHSNPTLA